MTKRFVVRDGARPHHAFESATLDPEREKGRPKILYDCQVPDGMALTEAIRLYKLGVRAKATVEVGKKRLKPLAEILRIKRGHRKRGLGITYNEREFLEK